MTITPGKETTEHARASRAEVAAGMLLAAGLVLVLLGTLSSRWTGAAVGLVLVALGTFLLASLNRSYMDSRGGVKAAAVRRPADSAPKRI